MPETKEDETGYLWRAPTTLELTDVEDEEGEYKEWVWSGPTKAVRRTHRYTCDGPKTMEELAKMSSLELCRYTPTTRYLLPPIPSYHAGNCKELAEDTKTTTGGTAAGNSGGTADNEDKTRATKRRKRDNKTD